jgi:LMBR1 domain-containing protein 1
VLFLTWVFLKYAEIPVDILEQLYASNNLSSSVVVVASNYANQISHDTTLQITVSFPVYTMALLSWIGWIFFVIFGGVGLTALPLDLIMDFVNRPKLRKSMDVMQTKNEIKTRT